MTGTREARIAAILAAQRAEGTARRYAASDKEIKAALAPFIDAALDLWEGKLQRYTVTPEGAAAEGIARVFLDRMIREKRAIGEEGAALEALAETVQNRTGGRRRGDKLQTLVELTTAADIRTKTGGAAIIPLPSAR